MDDIVIYAASLEEHMKRLKEVLLRLRKNSLKIQPDKCEFLRKETNFLGHIITCDGILPDPSKIEAVTNFPVPKKAKDIQSFIGLAGYYRKFIPDFSKIARPMTQLLTKNTVFLWTSREQESFELLKKKLTSAPILQYPDFNKEFIVTTDASDKAIGAILSQGRIGQDLPVSYASRTLNKAEQNYSTTEKELLAIVWAVTYFRPYLYGTNFKIITDHKPLTWLFSVKDPGSRLMRWRLKLEEYNYEVEYKAGKLNTNADALSRIHALTRAQSRTLGKEDVELERASEPTKTERNKQTNYTGAYEEVPTKEEKIKILREYHDTPLGGHQGVQRTYDRIKLKYDWPGLKQDVNNLIKNCDKCQKNKTGTKTKMPMVITDTPSEPFEKCALDIVGPLTGTLEGNKYILTFQDLLTKYSEAIPIPNQEANTIAKEFVTQIVCRYGTPLKLLTDQGTNFLSEIFKNVCKLLKIEKIQTTAYHPQTNGALERSHKTLADYLKNFVNEDQTNWDLWLPYAMFAYNTTPHTATGMTPYELLFGKRAELPTALKADPRPSYTYDNYASELRERIRSANAVARVNLEHAKAKSKINYDKNARPRNFKVGDKVLLQDETIRRGRSKKLAAKWIGPYKIITKHSDENYTIKLRKKLLRVHANRLKHFIE